MITNIFKIECLSNLHAGSGDSGGFGVVDKLVQREHSNNLPTIYASSLKGALREHFKGNTWEEKVFGSDSQNRTNVSRGEYRFFAADLIALPKPVSAAPYFQRVTSQKYLEDLVKKYKDLGDTTIDLAKLQADFTDDPHFYELAEDLPVIARNQLDNGVSENLWYEEVVPRQAVFVVCIQSPDDQDLIAELEKSVVVQLGGNATVGYGFCKFSQL